MKRFDYYFGDMAIISWYNKKMPKKKIAEYSATYGPLVRIESSTMVTIQTKIEDDPIESRPIGFERWN